MTLFWTFVLFGSGAVCAYVYTGYPALIYLLARWRPRPVRKGPVRPPVTIIVAAHNEDEVIDDKIRNSLDLEYPGESLEVLVGSNNSSDRTDEIVAGWQERDGRVRLVAIERQGKAFALNRCAEVATGEILVFTDANTLLDEGSLIQLVENYADPEVGAVTGNKRAQKDAASDATSEGEGVYWRYEMWQKQMESTFGSCYIGDGSYHSIRRELYVPITDPARGDDISISTRAVLQGYRLIFEPGAVVRERASRGAGNEIRRKMRITNRSLRALFGLGGRLWTSGFYSVELISHKVLRHLVPFFLLAMLVSNLALVGAHAVFALLLAGQLAFYGLALAGLCLRETGWGRSKVFWIPFYFVFVNWAALLGVLSMMRGKRAVTWVPRSGA